MERSQTKRVLITGSLGLVGIECVRQFLELGYEVYGIDNNQRAKFFNLEDEQHEITDKNYNHFDFDIRDTYGYGVLKDIKFDVIIHTAAQPSHALADSDPSLDFSVNVCGTQNLLEFARMYSPKATFIYLSTTKVFSDFMNDFVDEGKTRYTCHFNIIEDDDIQGHHGMFGVHKLMSDLMVQEYGIHYGLKTIVLRPGCITGKNHRGTREHGFLSYLAKCVKEDTKYIINGYKGKQVRDQIHVEDLVKAIVEITKDPKTDYYVIGGGLENSVSVLEAIKILEKKLHKKLDYDFIEAREADHKWNVHDNSKLMAAYPNWKITKDLDYIFNDLL